jgi:hypothetical protein
MRPELEALLDEILGPDVDPLPKPKVVTSDGRAIRDANIPVHPTDVNARNAVDGVVSVRRVDRWQSAVNREAAERAEYEQGYRLLKPGQVRVRTDLAMEQWEINRQLKAEAERRGRGHDPYAHMHTSLRDDD